VGLGHSQTVSGSALESSHTRAPLDELEADAPGTGNSEVDDDRRGHPTSESYTAKASALNGIESVRKNAAAATVVDET
jgi:hypothetical protein